MASPKLKLQAAVMAVKPAEAGDAAAVRARVLVVDDDERNLLALTTVLEDVADVVTASSGEEALRHLLKDDFAVILLDVYMPGIDGYETAQIIRQREQSKRIPIIFVSAVNKEDDHLLRGYAMGAVDYVFKPVEPMILKSKVAVFVDLFEKTREIQRKAEREQRLLDENLRVNTEKLLAEQALRRAEEQQAAIIRSLPLALYVRDATDASVPPQLVGGDFAALTGVDRAMTPGEWIERIHPDDRDRVLASHSAHAAGGLVATEYRWRGDEHGYRHFLDQSIIVRDEDGTAKEIVGTLLDVTERKQLEGQLLQAQKMDAIGKLTGGIAHDFNNLLAAVLGGLGLIERRCQLPDEGKRILDMTRHAADQGAELVRRLLAFSRRQQLQPRVVRLPALPDTMNDLLAHTLGGLVRVDWRIGEPLWPAFVDPNQLELALMNLVINARDAMPEGGAIVVAAENRGIDFGGELGLSPGEYVVISVLDTGTGIAPDILDRVTEPFFTTKDVGKGTGLGLSMVYGFAQQSGGTLRIDSVVGQGTRIEIWLPRAAADAAEPAAPVEAPLPAPASARALRVLLVDDNPDVRAVTGEVLADGGHDVTSAGGGAEALAILERDPDAFDVVVTDYAMPLVSGLEVIRLARNLRPTMPALLITGYADLEMLSNRPADIRVLPKPFDPDALIRAVGDCGN
ncbi:response regulator [Sphingoaurantiacus capsulatus]|uniref:histidine kinase n=1 Tax=Sphingoaurantiacus capsulatus TaxID=1771310 RepID=A0ABV7X9Q4_9SPHN